MLDITLDRFIKLSNKHKFFTRKDEIIEGEIVISFSHLKRYNIESWKVDPLSVESRGICFNEQGDIIARPFNKFFNINELNLDDTSNNEEDGYYVNKYDGSMVYPLLINNKVFFRTTRSTLNEISTLATEFAYTNIKLIKWVKNQINNGYTPIFEYVSNKRTLHVKYNSTNLKLIGIRNMKTGVYKVFDKALVKSFYNETGLKCDLPIKVNGSLDKLYTIVKPMKDIEGFVYISNDGQRRYKLKTDWYLNIHRAVKVSKRSIAQLIIDNKIDDFVSILKKDANVWNTYLEVQVMIDKQLLEIDNDIEKYILEFKNTDPTVYFTKYKDNLLAKLAIRKYKGNAYSISKYWNRNIRGTIDKNPVGTI